MKISNNAKFTERKCKEDNIFIYVDRAEFDVEVRTFHSKNCQL